MTSVENNPFMPKRYYMVTLDPTHIGTGGYRLGRVDNTIVREHGSNLPKIPGSSIAGVARAYTAMAIQSENPLRMTYQREHVIEIIKPDGTKEPKKTFESCAGKGLRNGDGHCGKPDCEVCVPFGFSKDAGSFQGLAQFYDARILFFPVHSKIGPVWITCPSLLKEEGLSDAEVSVDKGKFKAMDGAPGTLMNFGWLMLERQETTGTTISIPSIDEYDAFKDIKNRCFILNDSVFPKVVNDNLEVRTSVAIDPATGAAEEGALFTYEAIPRLTFMKFDIVYNDPSFFKLNGNVDINLAKPNNYSDPLRSPGREDQAGFMAFNIEKGMSLFEHLGIGGMNTRGMGRVKVLNIGGC